MIIRKGRSILFHEFIVLAKAFGGKGGGTDMLEYELSVLDSYYSLRLIYLYNSLTSIQT